jgi:outer membrane receptor for ferrienterochelin and colicins
MELKIIALPKTHFVFIFTTIFFVFFPTAAFSTPKIDDLEKLLEMSLEELFNIKITTASGLEESIKNAPAAMIVVTAKEIKQRGYSDLSELLSDLPGFDIKKTRGGNEASAFQRGYRTIFTQRTLILIDGKVDNTLWLQAAVFSNQYSITNISRVEILYGPASTLYGANAFLGVINIITKSPKTVNQAYTNINISSGSFNTRFVDMAGGTRLGEIGLTLAFKKYLSDGPGLNDLAPWGYLKQEQLSDRTVWGPVLDHKQVDGIPYGRYTDTSDSYNFQGRLYYNDVTLEYFSWRSSSGYGPYYTTDRAQSNVPWSQKSNQVNVNYISFVNDLLTVESQVLFRSYQEGGGWAEASPDNGDNINLISSPSYVSISDWNSFSDSRLLKQTYKLQVSNRIQFHGGIDYENKHLNKAFETCNYWTAALCQTEDPNNLGPEGLGPGIYHSTATSIPLGVSTQHSALYGNVSKVTNQGAYLLSVIDFKYWRFNVGLRYDNNSTFGSIINPRLAVNWNLDDKSVLKFIYGTAFQEASPAQLYGGWNGRNANPNLAPEKAQNSEIVYIYQQQNMSHDFSLFAAHYENVIQEASKNFGARDISGFEYRGHFNAPNFLGNLPDISGYIFYTHTYAKSSIDFQFNQSLNGGKWIERETTQGDISPNKINLGFNIPLSKNINVNLRSNYVSGMSLYARNPLHAENKRLPSHTTLDGNLIYTVKKIDISLKIKNIFNKMYYQPGIGAADSGDNFENRSLGFNNSLLPQTGREYYFSLNYTFNDY